jgi:hypothetical protein
MSDRMKRAVMVFIFLIVIIGFAAALVQLFNLRFESGDHLPPYSSHRSDPLGTKALYESLSRFDQMQITRHYRDLHRLEPDDRTVVLFLGLDPYALSNVREEVSQNLDRIMVDGGRMVITMFPVQRKKEAPPEKDLDEEPEESEPEKDVSEEEYREDEPKGKKKIPDLPKLINIREHWDFKTKSEPTPKGREGKTAQGRHEAASWPDISWHSDIHFTDLGPAWHVLYYAQAKPVIIWRKWGRGTLVLASDSYFVSNEALRKEPRPELLSWLVGDKTRIVFNETHLGMYEQAGVASLARKYGLGGMLVALLVLAALFVWKNAFSLVPPKEDESQDSDGVISAGRDYYAGLISLLQRNIPPNRILRECFKAYRRSTEERRENLGDAMDKAQAVLGGDDKKSRPDPVAGYRIIHQIIAEKKSWKKARSS